MIAINLPAERSFAAEVNRCAVWRVDMEISDATMKGPMLLLYFQCLIAFALMTGCGETEQLYADPIPNETPPAPVQLLALGDSYTIGQSVAASDRWPNLLATELGKAKIPVQRTQIIARTGWTTGNLISAIETQKPDSNFNLVGLLIGVNNQYQGRSLAEYEVQFQQLLTTAIALAGGHKERVFVVSIPDYGYTPYGENNQPGISAALDQFNAANLQLTQTAGIQYFDITAISRRGLAEPDLVANDGLHPSGKQYAAWVDLMLPGIKEMVQ